MNYHLRFHEILRFFEPPFPKGRTGREARQLFQAGRVPIIMVNF